MIEQGLGARLVEGHPGAAQRLEHGRLVIDTEHAETAVGEAQGEWQPHPAQSDDGNVRLGHCPCRPSKATLGMGTSPGSAGWPRTSPL